MIFVNLINMCLGVFRLGFILFGTLWDSWIWVIISFPILGKFSTIISSSIFSWSFFLSSSSGTPMIRMLGHLTLSQRFLRMSSFLLIHFSFFWVPDVLCRHSEVILWNLLSVQVFFWWIFGGECGLPILFLCHFSTASNWFIWKDPDAGKDWRLEEKGMTKDEMVGWHHWTCHRTQWTWVWASSGS